MRVADVYSDAKIYLGNVDQTTVFAFMSDAIEIINNKGEWDALKCYLDLPVQSANLVTLPAFVDSVIKANVDNSPAFSRDRIYEFSMNGPGSNTERSGYAWEDKGLVPTLVTLPSASRLLVPIAASDNGKKVVIVGLDSSNNEITETLTLSSSATVATTQTFAKLTQVNKDATTSSIGLYTTSNGTTAGTLLSTYQPFELRGEYRQIRLSKTGVTAHLLVRRKSFRINSQDDFIPIQSRIGFLLMIKALMAFRRSENLELARKYEEDAVRLTTEAQRAATSYVDLAKDTEKDSARNLNINNRDSIIVSDIFDDICAIVGPVGTQNVFDSITEGLEALNNKGHWDGLVGYVDIFTDGQGYVTLPRYVESPIEINLGGQPTFMRNKWFEFHLNGPGSNCNEACGAWDWIGDVCLQKPLTYIAQLVATPDSNTDDGKIITIYGYDENDKWIRTAGVDGFTVAIDHTKVLPLSNDQKVARIERITRDTTSGFVRLTGYSVDQTQSVQLGYYYPDETEPQYMRIKIPRTPSGQWIRMRYRKRTLKVASMTDPLHLKSKIAIIQMIRALAELGKDAPNMELATAFEVKALQFMEEEQSSRNPGETFSIQVGGGWGSNLIAI